MDAQRRLKKSEFLEVRLPYPTKQAFMRRCHAEGLSASEAVRGFIDGFVAGPAARRAPPPWIRLIAAGAALLACGLAAAPSFAGATAPAGFARLDVNHDGQVTLAEFDRSAQVQVALAPRADRWLQTVGLSAVPAEPPLDAKLRHAVLEAAFREIDADRDGSISLAEYRRRRG